jgi:ubiquinone biosynthesis protein
MTARASLPPGPNLEPPKNAAPGARVSRTSLPPPGTGGAPVAAGLRARGAAYRAASKHTFRFVRAYVTTVQVLVSYLWLGLCTRLLGTAYRERRITAIHQLNAKRVERTILQLQGLFIKVGQLLSILANFLPQEFRTPLEGLQDQVPPRPLGEIEARILVELGAPTSQLFASFEKRPIASASLGQVHEARMHDGTRVAVKVQHHDIDTIVRIDLLTIRRIMGLVQWFVPVQGLDSYYLQVRSLLEQELDFELEADNVERIAKNFAQDPTVKFPKPIRELSTRRVLTATFVEGNRLGDAEALKANRIDKKALAERLVRAFCQMIFVDGVYHADPHPGNILVDAAGNLVLLDFGAVAELSTSMREGIPEFLEGALRRDTDRILKSLRKMGFISRTSDSAMAEKVVEFFHTRLQDEIKIESFNLKDIKLDPQRGVENLLDLRKMNVGMKELSSVLHIPKDWVLLERTILLVYGTCSLLDPEMHPMQIIRPYLQEFVLGNRDFSQIAIETVREMAMDAISLPEDLKKYLRQATRGELAVRVPDLWPLARVLAASVRQLVYAALSISCGFVALQFHFHGEPVFARYALYACATLAVVLSGSLLFGRPRKGEN